MTTEYTKQWLSKPQNQRMISAANDMARELNETGKSYCHPIFLFQEMACHDFVWSEKDLKEQGWTNGAIKKHLSDDVIFSCNGVGIYLAGLVREASVAMPNCAAKTKIVICKLCR